jgi:hypothetical protein
MYRRHQTGLISKKPIVLYFRDKTQPTAASFLDTSQSVTEYFFLFFWFIKFRRNFFGCLQPKTNRLIWFQNSKL